MEEIKELPDHYWVCPLEYGEVWQDKNDCEYYGELTQERIDEHIADGGLNGDKMKVGSHCHARCFGDPCIAVKYTKEQP